MHHALYSIKCKAEAMGGSRTWIIICILGMPNSMNFIENRYILSQSVKYSSFYDGYRKFKLMKF